MSIIRFMDEKLSRLVESALTEEYEIFIITINHLCGLVVRVLGYRSGGPGSIPGTTRKKSSGFRMGSTHPREYN
jgi:hypothetical protein